VVVVVRITQMKEFQVECFWVGQAAVVMAALILYQPRRTAQQTQEAAVAALNMMVVFQHQALVDLAL
jgi:hypothetical protein